MRARPISDRVLVEHVRCRIECLLSMTTRSAPLYFKKLGGSVCYPGFWDTVRHPADRFQCLLELLNLQL